MIKLILLVRRKPGLSREAFRAYYETTHAPLAARLMDKCVRYVRNFVSDELEGRLGFDAITEFWFDVEGPWSEARKGLADASTNALLEADEERFMDRGSMEVLMVEEQETDLKWLLGSARKP